MTAPIVQNMIDTHGYPVVTTEGFEAFAASNEYVVLFFHQLMKPVPETADVAVILPELDKAFADRFTVGVVAWEAQRDLQLKFRFRKYPSLVFLKDGGYLGVISGVLDWSDYLVEIETILNAEVSEPPPFVLPGAANGAAGSMEASA